MVLVLLRRLSRSTGFHNRDDLRKPPSGEEEGRPPFGDKVGNEVEVEVDPVPSGEEKGRPPFGEEKGRFKVRGDRNDAVGSSVVGGR
jgi:hypothetical protein